MAAVNFMGVLSVGIDACANTTGLLRRQRWACTTPGGAALVVAATLAVAALGMSVNGGIRANLAAGWKWASARLPGGGPSDPSQD